MARRTKAQVEAWRILVLEDFMTGKISMKELAVKYNVSNDTISKCITIKLKENGPK
jgi:predicted DNA-binding protein YlxM (UPF0122 family)